MKSRIKDIMDFLKGTSDEHIGAFAAQSAFFIFLSFFPIINIFIFIPKLLPISQEQVLELIYYILPSTFEGYVAGLVNEMYSSHANSITIISVVIALWSAAKGLMAVRNGLNEVYRSRESRNFLIIRGISAIYTLVFIVIVLLLIPLNMFGTQIAQYILGRFPNLANVTLLVYSLRGSATFILLFIMFELMYTIVPSKKLKFKRQIPGALLASFLWVAVTKLFSLYIDYYASQSFMYGSLTTVIMLMFWMYFVISFIFVGAQLNEYLHMCRKRKRDEEELAAREEKENAPLTEEELEELVKEFEADNKIESSIEYDQSENV